MPRAMSLHVTIINTLLTSDDDGVDTQTLAFQP